jgi:hypothetical protein
MWDKIKAWLGITQKKADAAFDEAGDVIKGYGREANALAHEASGKILETMKPRDELGTKIGALM